jgi:hypothetical protein
MSQVKRKGLKFIIDQIGKAKYAYKSLVGDLTVNRGFFLDYEAIIPKIKGSTIFHDYDLAGKTLSGSVTTPYQIYNANENISFGFQGGEYSVDPKIAGFANTGDWSPQYHNPPTTEGWGVYDYNAWSTFVPPYNSAGNANTSYIIYNINSEPGTGIARTAFSYPVRYSGTGYTQVNLFNSSRWISLRNTTGASSVNEARIIVPKSYFENCLHIDPKTNTPKDLAVYSHQNLLTEGIGSTFALGGSMAGIALTLLPFSIQESSSTGSTTAKIRNNYLIKVRTPATWTNNYWFHFGFYWETFDLFFRNYIPTYTTGTATTFNSANLDSSWYIFPRKTYFQKDITNYLNFSKTGVNDSNIYLFSQNKSNNNINDGDFPYTLSPFRYKFPETIDKASTGDTNSLSNFYSLSANEFLPLVITSTNVLSGNEFENDDNEIFLFFGKPMPITSAPSDWSLFDNYPSIDDEYNVIAKLILSYPSLTTSNTIKKVTNTSYNLNNASVVYIDRKANNFAVPPLGDTDFAYYSLQEILAFSTFTRGNEFEIYFNTLLTNLVVPFTNFQARGSQNISTLSPNNLQLLHNLLKYPKTDLLRSNNNFISCLGTISINGGTNVVVGKNTKFLSEVTIGDYIYNEDGTILFGIVSNINSNSYILLETQYKKTIVDQAFKIKNSISETEPEFIDISLLGNKAVSDVGIKPPTKTFYEYSNDGIILSKDKLNFNTEFEVYLKNSLLNNLSNHQNSGNKLVKDYSLAIKFRDSNQNFINKNIFLNSSKFLVSDQEYAFRKSKKLILDGYYKKGTSEEQKNIAEGTLNTIDLFRLYGNSAIIADLQMGESRTILSKQVAPIDNTKISKSDYINDLKISNPIITQAEIDDSILEYELTNSFYSADDSSIPNLYNGVEEVGITVSDYSTGNPHWFSNIENIIGTNQSSKFYTPNNINDLRSDSFLICVSGYGTADNSINSIENIFKQQIQVDSSTGINVETTAGTKNLFYEKIAFKFTSLEKQDVKSFKVKLSKTSKWLNEDAFIQCALYDSYENLPSNKLCTGSKIFYKDIENISKDVYFYINYSLTKDRTYWMVFESNTIPPEYDQKTKGLVNVNDTVVSGIYNPANDSYTNFNDYLTNAEIGFGSTVASGVSTWYAISGIASSTSMTVSSTGATLSNQNYVIKYKFNLSIQESSPSTQNIATYDGYEWTYQTGTPYRIFFTNEEEIYGSFNRNFDNTNLTMAPVNNTRSTNDYFVDGYWSVNNKDIFTPSFLRIYPRSLVNRFTGIAATGSSGTNIINIFEQNFDESIMIGVGVTSSVLSSGTAITNIIYNENSLNYSLYLSSNLTSSGNTTYYFGDNSTRLIKRLNDIHLYLKYYVNDTLNTTYFKLDKSPTWTADWYKKEDWNYNDLDTNQPFDLRSTHNKSDISNFSGLGQTNYFNGVLSGDFISKSSIGTTFDFRITSNGGIKLVINEETSPYINQWKNNSSNSFTASYVATGASSAVNLRIEFCNQENNHFLKAEWRKTGEAAWNDIDSSFYFEPDIAPILINANKIKNLSYLVVGKTQDEISTPTLGFPETDRFTLRNK